MKPGLSFKPSRLALTIAIMVAVFLPLGYFVLGYQKLVVILETEVEANALFVSPIINANPDFWPFEQARLQEFLSHRSITTASEKRRITTLNGEIVAQNQDEVGNPFIVRSHDLHDSGKVVAKLEIVRSLRPLLGETILVGVFGCLLMAAIYLPLKKYIFNDREESEKALHESEERYKLLVSNIPAVVFTGYWDWTVDLFGEKIDNFMGYKKEDFNSRRLKWIDVVVEEDLHHIKQVFKQALKTNGSYVREYRIRTKEGKIIWLQERSRIICRDEGKADYISGVFFDITERRQAEDDLRRAHAEIEQIFTSITSILIGLAPTGEVRHWNEEAEKVLKVQAAEAVGKKLHKLTIQWQWTKISEALGECRKKCRSVRAENVRFRRQDGKDGFLGVTISPIKEESGEVTGLILLGRDITERLILETQLAQAQKLESIGQLAAGIAHEINTPIQYVGDNTRFLGDAFKDLVHLQEKYKDLLEAAKAGAVAEELIDRAESAMREIDLDYLMDEIPVAISQSLEGVERVAKIVRAMKDFSHPGAAEKRAVDINKAIENTIIVARNEWKYVAEMVTDLDLSLPLVPCRPDEFNQVILNIIINAAHAIAGVVGQEPAEKGRITVKTRKNGEAVEILISDTGGGIPEEIRSRIFDPFFTTKEVGKGTGQGLAISHAVIVDKHGGAIDFETEMGRGTTFIIRLPGESAKSEKG
jgi:PAS domain S-box-containing protein